jgi:hypothetical protein
MIDKPSTRSGYSTQVTQLVSQTALYLADSFHHS